MHDKLTGIYYDIKNNVYSMILPSGENANRFEITFKNVDADIADENIVVANSFQVYQNNSAGMLTILNPMKKDVVDVVLFDITGKK